MLGAEPAGRTPRTALWDLGQLPGRSKIRLMVAREGTAYRAATPRVAPVDIERKANRVRAGIPPVLGQFLAFTADQILYRRGDVGRTAYRSP